MDKADDVQLIHRVLSGDDAAFNTLIEKHQKSIHALVWRKVGDFHYAEEITQDTFLRAYKKLSTLKNPHQFAGWLYVIANRLCLNWIRKQKPAMQSLDAMSVKEIEKLSYEKYISEQRETQAHEHRYDIVKKLLAQLPESERTVLTLYYLGEMTTKEISKFLGVSINTITSRLQRGRRRLRELQEEDWVQEVLGGVQIPANLAQNIMQQIANIKPTPPSAVKPLLPWQAFGTAAVLIILLLSGSAQYLARFQKPYSFEAQSEPTIEIIDAPITIDVVVKPTVKNQIGRATTLGKSMGNSTQTSDATSVSVTSENRARPSTALWTQGNTPPGGQVHNVFAGPKGTLYAVSPTGMYRLAVGATTWTRIEANIPIGKSRMPMADHEGTLYIASTDEIFTSNDSGETWNSIGTRPKGYVIGFIITGTAQARISQASITMYLALQDKGIYRSTDGGVQWNPLNDGLRNERITATAAVGKIVHALQDKGIYRSTDGGVQWNSLSDGLGNERITAIAAVGKIIFVGTNSSLYRLDSGIWKKLPIGVSQTVHSLAAFDNNLYVATGPDLPRLDSGIQRKLPVGASQTVHSLAAFNNNLYVETGPDLLGFTPIEAAQAVPKSEKHSVTIFHSSDLGASWTEITHIDKLDVAARPSDITVVAAGETILTLGAAQSRSTDGGQTWTDLGLDTDRHTIGNSTAVAVNERTFYKADASGIHRTTDSGESWHLFMDGIVGTEANDLVVFNNRLYTHTGYEVYQSPDEGVSWKKLSISGEFAVEQTALEPLKQDRLRVHASLNSKLMVDGNSLYFVSPERHILRIYRLSADGSTLIPVQEISTFDHESLLPAPEKGPKVKAILVSNNVFYAEYKRRLFKWKLGDPNWTDTGVVDTSKQPNADLKNGFKLAVSGETLYVGMRNGKLFQSLDEGDSWRDVTSSLPLHFAYFNEIIFVGASLYVATDSGVLVSHTGDHWRVLTDSVGERPIINRFAIDGNKIYGIGDAGVYRLNTPRRWKQISSEVLGEVTSLAVINNRLYSAVNAQGIFHISLEEK